MANRAAAIIAYSTAVAVAAPLTFHFLLPENNSLVKKANVLLSERLARINQERWMAGVDRPNRIILVRVGQMHGFSDTCGCEVEGQPVCALKPEMQRPLTEEGKLQALSAGVALREIIGNETVAFFVSPYKAATQTFRYISGSFSESVVRYTEDPRLRNQYFGMWSRTDAPHVREKLDAEAQKVGPFYYKYPNGESAADVYDRTSSFMETLYRKWNQPNSPSNFVIITHNVVIQTFLTRWFHWDIDTFSRLKRFPGGSLAVMEKQRDGSYKLVSQLPIEGSMPDGVREIAANPVIKKE